MEYKLSDFEHFYKFSDDVNNIVICIYIFLNILVRKGDRQRERQDKTRQEKKSVKFVY